MEGPSTPPDNPFSSAMNSRSPSRFSIRRSSIGSSAVDRFSAPASERYFHSRRIRKGEVERTWVETKDPREKWTTIIPLIGVFFGLCIMGVLVWDGMRTVVNHNYCLILDEKWENGLDPTIWTKEIQLGGYGNGQFEMTTDSEENIFMKDGNLVIKPTLQEQKLINNNTIVDLRKGGFCTSRIWSDCLTSTNTTNGTIVNPAKSGRINTKKGAVIKYGKVEVTATIPSGDWLWPAIWMLPVDRKYGEWPRSGEIDIMESRGNNFTYEQGGNNIVSSALHWGPNPDNDAWWRTNNKRKAMLTTYPAGPHVFGMEWSSKYVFTYVDNRLLQVLYFDFDGSLYKRGGFPLADRNGSSLFDPWSQTGNPATPFDQDFYLVINVAVGGTNGWFEDGKSGKPWVDRSPTAKRDFWDAREAWSPTWEGGGQMTIHRVKIWQEEGFRGC